MKRTILTILFIMLALPTFSTNVGSAPSGEIDIVSTPQESFQYELFSLRFNLPYFSNNHKGSGKKIDLNLVLVSPSKKKIVVPAFCKWNEINRNVSLWEARFTPTEIGKYEYYIDVDAYFLKDRTEKFYFTTKENGTDGFLRRSKNNPFYLVFDSGKPFFGIGHNVGWVFDNSIRLFDKYFSTMSINRCNLTRVWLCEWAFPLEWKRLGKYNQKSADKMDALVELLEKRNMYMILVIDTYGSIMSEEGFWNEHGWERNPYNAVNGGPCRVPEEFFTNHVAKRLYKEKLKYIVSRWGWSPNIAAFELWNEYDAPEEWVKEMASYIKSINPHPQMVTTSMGYPWGNNFDESKIWDLDEIDMVTIHMHGNSVKKEIVPSIMLKCHALAKRYGKPFIVSEFGIDSSKKDGYYDPRGEGVALHNSIWSTALLKSCASSMNWWWDTYIEPYDLHKHYFALGEFLKGVNWDSKNVAYTKISPVRKKLQSKGLKTPADLVIKPKDEWCKLYSNETILLNSGDIMGAEPNKYLHGRAKKDFKIDHIYQVNYPEDGKFIIHIDVVSQGGRLLGYVDGRKVLNEVFSVGEGNGPWERILYRKDEDVYQAVYNTDVVINVPKGEHTIRLVNTGKDWIGIKRITLTNYLDKTLANARALSLTVGDDILCWIQNKDYNWKNNFYEVKPTVIVDSYFEVYDIENGVYNLEWWDTYEGKVLFAEEVVSENKKIIINVPDLEKDIACKISLKKEKIPVLTEN